MRVVRATSVAFLLSISVAGFALWASVKADGTRAAAVAEEPAGLIADDSLDELRIDDAQAVLETVFDDVLPEPLGPALELRASERIVKYLEPNVAVVESPNGKRRLLVSTFPLRSRSAAGRLGPVNLELRREGADYEPLRGTHDLEIPRDPSEPIELGSGSSELSVTPLLGRSTVFERDNQDSQVIDSGVFHANVAQDSDMIITPRLDGFETRHQFRTGDAPRTVGFEVNAASPVDIAEADGIVSITSGREQLATVQPPVAFDAVGAPVAVAITVDENTVGYTIKPGPAAEFPILLDPIWTADFEEFASPWTEREFRDTGGHYAADNYTCVQSSPVQVAADTEYRISSTGPSGGPDTAFPGYTDEAFFITKRRESPADDSTRCEEWGEIVLASAPAHTSFVELAVSDLVYANPRHGQRLEIFMGGTQVLGYQDDTAATFRSFGDVQYGVAPTAGPLVVRLKSVVTRDDPTPTGANAYASADGLSVGILDSTPPTLNAFSVTRTAPPPDAPWNPASQWLGPGMSIRVVATAGDLGLGLSEEEAISIAGEPDGASCDTDTPALPPCALSHTYQADLDSDELSAIAVDDGTVNSGTANVPVTVVDLSGNVTQAPQALRLDLVDPSQPGPISVSETFEGVDVTWPSATDQHSGISGYRVQLDIDPDFEQPCFTSSLLSPSTTSFSVGAGDLTTPAPGCALNVQTDEPVRFYARAVAYDVAGNSDGESDTGSVVESTAPYESVTIAAPMFEVRQTGVNGDIADTEPWFGPNSSLTIDANDAQGSNAEIAADQASGIGPLDVTLNSASILDSLNCPPAGPGGRTLVYPFTCNFDSSQFGSAEDHQLVVRVSDQASGGPHLRERTMSLKLDATRPYFADEARVTVGGTAPDQYTITFPTGFDEHSGIDRYQYCVRATSPVPCAFSDAWSDITGAPLFGDVTHGPISLPAADSIVDVRALDRVGNVSYSISQSGAGGDGGGGDDDESNLGQGCADERDCPPEPIDPDTGDPTDEPGELADSFGPYMPGATGGCDFEADAACAATKHKLGLEDHQQFHSLATGAGGEANVNVNTGNLAWHLVPMVNPGRGLSTVMNVTYNSQDASFGTAGFGWSVGISGTTRLNERLRFSPGQDSSVFLTDPDGTLHEFEDATSDAVLGPVWQAPPGYNARLRVFDASSDDRRLALTRPDGVTFFFDALGYQTAIVDRSGNTMRFNYEVVQLAESATCSSVPGDAANDPEHCYQRVRSITDAAGTSGLGLFGRAWQLSYRPDVRYSRSGEYFLRPGLLNDVRDHRGTHVALRYDSHRSIRMIRVFGESGAGSRRFSFGYDGTTPTRKLTSVTDPRGSTTEFRHDPGDSPAYTEAAKTVSVQDRDNVQAAGSPYRFTYVESPPLSPGETHTVVTGPKGNPTAYVTDQARGLVKRITDATGAVTEVEWDAFGPTPNPRYNVVSVTRPGGAKTQMEYDAQGLGLLTKVASAEQMRAAGGSFNAAAKTEIVYAFSAGTQRAVAGSDDPLGDGTGLPFVADVVERRDELGNRSTFAVHANPFDGLIRERSDLGANGEMLSNETFAYDQFGQVLTVDTHGVKVWDQKSESESEDPKRSPNQPVPENTDLRTFREEFAQYDASGQPTVRFNRRDLSEDANPSNRKPWRYQYDASGLLLSVTDPRAEGMTQPAADQPLFSTEFAYDALGNQIEVRTSSLSDREGCYDPVDSEAERIDEAEACAAPAPPEYITTKTKYDRNGNVVSRTDGRGKRTRLEYSTMDQVTAETRPLATRTETAYDSEQNVVRSVDPMGRFTDFTVDQLGRKTAEIRRGTSSDRDITTHFRYDARGNLAAVADPRSSGPADERYKYAYNHDDQVVQLEESRSGKIRIAKFVYDAAGRRVSEARSFDGNETSGDPDSKRYATTTTVYDGLGRAIRTVDPRGAVQETRYDRDGTIMEVISPNGFGGAVTDAPNVAAGKNGFWRTEFDYYPTGELKRYKLPKAARERTPEYFEFRYRRDAVGNPTHIRDGRGNLFKNRFYDNGYLRSTTRPSFFKFVRGAEREISEREPSELDVNRSGEVEMDLPDENDPEGSLGAVKPLPLPGPIPRAGEARFNYDENWRLTTVSDQAHRKTTFSHDSLGRLKSIRQPFDVSDSITSYFTRKFSYDKVGNLTQETDGRSVKTSFGYDEFDRQVSVSRPSPTTVATEHSEYDKNGNVVRTIDRRGLTKCFGYDGFDQKVAEVAEDGTLVTSTYNLGGLKTSSVDAIGNYDEDHSAGPGRARTCAPSDARDVPDNLDTAEARALRLEHTTIYTYAINGLLRRTLESAVVKPDSSSNDSTNYGNPDDVNNENDDRFSTIAPGVTDATDFRRVTINNYDRNGNLILKSEPGAPHRIRTSYRYNGRDQLWKTRVLSDGLNRVTINEYDGNGNLRRQTKPSGVRFADGDSAVIDRAYPHNDFNFADDSVRQNTKLSEGATVYEYSDDNLLTGTHMPWSDSAADRSHRYFQGVHRTSMGFVRALDAPYDLRAEDPTSVRVRYRHYATGWIRAKSNPYTANPKTEKELELRGANDARYSYDKQGNQIKTDLGSSVLRRSFYKNGKLKLRASSGDGKDYKYSYKYDPAGNLAEIKGSSYKFAQKHDARGRLTESLSQKKGGHDTLLSYDLNGNVIRRKVGGKRVDGSYKGGQTSYIDYDPLSREIETLINSSFIKGNDLTDTDSADDLVDGEGDEEKDEVGDRRVRSSYWPSGALKTRRGSNGMLSKFEYFASGQMSEMTRDKTGKGNAKNQRYDYDRDGNRIKDEKGTFDFNARGQLVTWERSKRYGRHKGTTVRYTLAGNGRLKKKVDTKGVGSTTTTYRYNAAELASVTTDGIKADYDYNEAGSLTRIKNPGGSLNYTYDSLQRLVKSNAPGSADDATFTYDPFDRKATRKEDGKTRTMAYVASSKQLAADISNKPKNLGAQSRYYDFGASLDKYNLETVKAVKKPAKKKSKKKKKKSKKSAAAWPSNAEVADAGEIDPGQFTEPVDRASDYAQPADETAAEPELGVPGPAAARFHRYQAGAEGFSPHTDQATAATSTATPLATTAAKKPKVTLKSTFRSLAKDVQGTVEGLEDKDGTSDANEAYDLDPYGALENEAQLSQEAKNNPIRFQGFTFDQAADLYDMQARHYRPEVARFMTRDRYESSALDFGLESDPLTNNLYAFAGGNPVNNVEWDGHRVKCKPNPFSQFGGQICTDDGTPGKNDKVNQGDYLTNTGGSVNKQQAQDLRYNDPGARNAVGYSVKPVPAPKPPPPVFVPTGHQLKPISPAPPKRGAAWLGQAISDVGKFIFDPSQCKHDRDYKAESCALQLGGLLPVGKVGKAGTEGAPLLAKVFGVGRGVAASNAGSAALAPAKRTAGITVLGHHPEYVNAADPFGFRRFEVPSVHWARMSDAERWTANRKFLDRTIARGDAIRLATPPTDVRPGSWFERELKYLSSRGYRPNADQTELLPPR